MQRSWVWSKTVLRLGNYRVFQESTTAWCPEREEHGYFLTPLFKCNTNPRVATAHRWIEVDIGAKLNRETGQAHPNLTSS